MVDFCNPGALGEVSEFRKKYARPILEGREPDATPAQRELGTARNEALSSIVNEFILRRTNALLSAHLPPKARCSVMHPFRLCAGPSCRTRVPTSVSCLWCLVVISPQHVVAPKPRRV